MEMLKWKEAFRKSIREIFFDSTCSRCRKEIDRNAFLCSNCLNKLKDEAYLKNIDKFYYLFYYDEKIREIIADYKLRGRKELGKDLAFIIGKILKKLIKDLKIEIVIPIPISKRRLKERGFNQINYILELLRIEYHELERVRNTEHMYNLNDYNERQKNVKEAFKNKLKLSNKKILLIDDIVTTGATIEAIIKELEEENKNMDIVVFSLAMSQKFIENKMGGNIGNIHR